jgi:hypothetical protein
MCGIFLVIHHSSRQGKENAKSLLLKAYDSFVALSMLGNLM